MTASMCCYNLKGNYELFLKAKEKEEKFKNLHGYHGREKIKRLLTGIARENKIKVTNDELISTVIVVEKYLS